DTRDPRQWPTAMRATLEAALGRSVDVLNLGRDGYSVLQMMDLAADRVGQMTDLVVFAFIHPDLVRSRGWMVRRDESDFPRIFRIATPDVADADRSRLIDTALINAAITPAWCQHMTNATERGTNGPTELDPVIQRVNKQYAVIAEEKATPVVMTDIW